MLRKAMLAIGAVAAIVLVAPDEASARGGYRAGGIGMGGAGFRAASVNGGFRGAAIAPGLRGGTFAGNAWRAGYRPGYRPWRGFRWPRPPWSVPGSPTGRTLTAIMTTITRTRTTPTIPTITTATSSTTADITAPAAPSFSDACQRPMVGCSGPFRSASE